MTFKSFLKYTLLFIVTIVILNICFVCLWNSSKDKHELQKKKDNEIIYQSLKKITIKNKMKIKVDLSVFFEYSKGEMTNNKDELVDFYNKSNFYFLDENEEIDILLPIPLNKSYKYPKGFRVKIEDLNKHLISEFNVDKFFKESIYKPIDKNNPYSANKWLLIVK
ncbi:hypothetical protein BWK59_10720 [Flavobacterium davisii]|uniref:Uncharacterized protein n=1 Tax=Flavobacterium davisii TaxID=2906077 RepID=A0A246GGU2_9FLAO|nr:hypothetical protein [Flavobacterium davisii]OWP83402.1 hypothetical protein BWK59_10720 [Flavobacterium davisii]